MYATCTFRFYEILVWALDILYSNILQAVPFGFAAQKVKFLCSLNLKLYDFDKFSTSHHMLLVLFSLR